jgi:hypothetical protein
MSGTQAFPSASLNKERTAAETAIHTLVDYRKHHEYITKCGSAASKRFVCAVKRIAERWKSRTEIES